MDRFNSTFEELDILMVDNGYSATAEIFKDTDNVCYYGTLHIFKVAPKKGNVVPLKAKELIKRVGIYGKTINDVLYDCQEAIDWYFNHPSTRGR